MTECSAIAVMKPASPPAGGRLLQRTCACGKHTPAGGECENCAGKRVQRKDANGMAENAIPASVNQALHESGTPMESRTLAMMASGFGHDFSAVRIHADGAAPESARAVNALAYTVGRDVVFAAGQ